MQGKNIGNIIARGTSKMFNNAVRGVKIFQYTTSTTYKINNPVKIPRRFPKKKKMEKINNK